MGLSALFIDVSTLPQNGYGFLQLLMVGAGYSYILMQGANMISDGSELLLLIPAWAGLVGCIVLPILGAVPDGAIVLFSGLGPDAQQKLAVGIGALAGSTIMLLTIPWFLSLWAGRVNMDADGNGNYVKPRGAAAGEWSKLTEGKVLGTGVNIGPSIKHAAQVMAVTLLPYFVIQVPAMVARCSTKDQDKEGDCETPKWAALVGGIMTVIMFAFYLWDQKRLADSDVVSERKKEDMQRKALDNGLITLAGLFAEKLTNGSFSSSSSAAGHDEMGTELLAKGDAAFRKFLRPYFKKFDADNSGGIDAHELKFLLESLGEKPTPERVAEMMAEMDKDNSGSIDFDEFVVAMEKAVKGEQFRGGAAQGDADSLNQDKMSARSSDAAPSRTGMTDIVNQDDEEDEEEEEEEMPEDLADLSPEEQQSRLFKRSFTQMGIGTIVVVLFSDPMVDVLSDLGTRTGIPAFYVAFVLAPLVSNGSELIAAYAYAGKKTEKTITISFATLVGSACMNNSLCLGIFLFIVFARDLKWVFTAEVTSIVFVEVAMIALVYLCGRTMKAWLMFLVLALFPISLVLVYVMENAIGLD
jgi:Ca2+/Na+ antiporter